MGDELCQTRNSRFRHNDSTRGDGETNNLFFTFVVFNVKEKVEQPKHAHTDGNVE
jgi:hypothetical protein